MLLVPWEGRARVWVIMKTLTLCDHRSAGACRSPRAVSGLVGPVPLTVELHQGECEVHVVGPQSPLGSSDHQLCTTGLMAVHIVGDGPRLLSSGPRRG